MGTSGRPRKRRIELNKSSLEGLMQEVYNENVELRRSAIKDINDRNNSADIDDTNNVNDIATLGKVNNESLRIVETALKNKMSIAKLMSDTLNKTVVSTNSDDSDEELSDDVKAALRGLINKDE